MDKTTITAGCWMFKRIEELDREFLREIKKALKAVGA